MAKRAPSKSSAAAPTANYSLFTEFDIHLFKMGKHFRLYEKLGAHYDEGLDGTFFAVWAPNAKAVSVIGNFNQWNGGLHKLRPPLGRVRDLGRFFPGHKTRGGV